jgi:hypothetical protein
VIDKDTPGKPTGDPPRQTRFRPPVHDGAQDHARDFAHLAERSQAIRTNVPATDADPQGNATP